MPLSLRKADPSKRAFFMRMKWVLTSPNHYKLVPDDDPRPAVLLPDRKGVPTLLFTPSWRKYEQNYWSPDPDKKISNDKTDKFLAEREHETKTNLKARRWEESRKKEWAKNKPAWRKKMMKEGVIK